MNQKLKYFVYSQNSLNTFKSCPLKFKYKYIDNINWKFDGIESRDYYEGLKSGSEFHLLCERYFKNIPIGENISEEFQLWMQKIKDTIKIDNSKIKVDFGNLNNLMSKTSLPELDVNNILNQLDFSVSNEEIKNLINDILNGYENYLKQHQILFLVYF